MDSVNRPYQEYSTMAQSIGLGRGAWALPWIRGSGRLFRFQASGFDFGTSDPGYMGLSQTGRILCMCM